MKALLLAPMGSVHRRFNKANIDVLTALGYEVHLAANFDIGDGTEKQNGEYVEQCTKKGIIIHSIAYERHSLLRNLSKIRETKKLLTLEQFDIVHAHTETGGLILRLAGKPYKHSIYVYTAHGMSFYIGSSFKSQMVYRPIERWICFGMNINIAINQEEYTILKKWNPHTANYVHGIGLDLERFHMMDAKCRERVRREFGIPTDVKVVLSVGELDDNKNHQVVIQALGSMARNDVYYIICGVGPKKTYLEKLVKHYGLEKQVVFAGYRKDIPAILHASDIFAFPSYPEGLPVSLMEAMAAQLPVVCSRIRGNVDLIQDGAGGYMCLPENVAEFTAALDRMLSKVFDYSDMAIWNYKRSYNYSYDYVKAELQAIYGGKDDVIN